MSTRKTGVITTLYSKITIDQYTNTDANTLTATGTYYMYTGCTNVPENYVHISVFHAQGLTGFVQMAYAATSGKIYKREYTNGSFTAWQELALNSSITSLIYYKDFEYQTTAFSGATIGECVTTINANIDISVSGYKPISVTVRDHTSTSYNILLHLTNDSTVQARHYAATPSSDAKNVYFRVVYIKI